MIPVDFSADDLLRGKLVTPGWYKLRIGDFQEEMSKDGDSTNAVARDSKIICAENGDEEFAGVPIPIRFSMKPTARGFMVGFFQALGEEIGPGKRFDLSAMSGKEVMAFIGNKTYEGRLVNEMNHRYKAVS